MDRPAWPAPTTTTDVATKGIRPGRPRTVVGLVMASNTAERFWDWATRAAISSRDTSASMSKVTVTLSNPLRTSPSIPSTPCRSMSPWTVAVTDRSWMPRLLATVATPAVRHDASAINVNSGGVAPLSSDAKTCGWSASTMYAWRWACSCPRPEKSVTVVRLCVPLTHSQRARHSNCAAAGASVRASRAPRSASMSTPLSTVGVAELDMVVPPGDGRRVFRHLHCPPSGLDGLGEGMTLLWHRTPGDLHAIFMTRRQRAPTMGRWAPPPARRTPDTDTTGARPGRRGGTGQTSGPACSSTTRSTSCSPCSADSTSGRAPACSTWPAGPDWPCAWPTERAPRWPASTPPASWWTWR